MASMNDYELLRRYVDERSERAFAQLVERYAGIVYSAALRQMRGDAHRAEDVTQQVFITLATKAHRLESTGGASLLLSGWLLTTTHYVCCNITKMEVRRRQHERNAAAERPEQRPPGPDSGGGSSSGPSPGDHDWEQISPLLDEAVEALGRGRREALLLRYFEGMSIRQVADRLGITEAAAKQRLSRGVEQLRKIFRRRGVTVSAAALSVMLGAHATHAAPVALVAAVASGAHAAAIAGGAAATAATTTTAAAAHAAGWKGLVTIMATTAKVKSAVAAVVALLLVGSATVVITKSFGGASKPQVKLLAPGAAIPAGGGVSITYNNAAANSRAIVYSGVVRTPDNQPVARAEVMLAGYYGIVQVNRLGFQNVPTVKTGSDGTFTTPPQADAKTIVVRCTAGYAEMPTKRFENGDPIIVQPWARVEGLAMSAGEPMANETIRMGRHIHVGFIDGDNCIDYSVTAKTDGQGRFTFTRLVPGTLWVGPEEPGFNTPESQLAAVRKQIKINGGETAKITIGDGGGRSVTGRISASDSMEPLKFSGQFYAAARGAATQPDEFDRVPTIATKVDRVFLVKTLADGRFDADDVPPGHYVLRLHAYVNNPGSMVGEEAASVTTEFDVPAAAAATRGSQAATAPAIFDLGTFTASVNKRLKPGDAAPPLRVTLKDGRDVTLADYAGRYLVLRIANPPGGAGWYEDPNDWTAVTDRFAGSASVALLNVTLDAGAIGGMPRQQQGPPVNLPTWEQATAKKIGGEGISSILGDGISSIYARSPVAVFVIGPNGKLAAKWCSPRGLFDVLAGASSRASVAANGIVVTSEHHDVGHDTPAYAFAKIPPMEKDDAGKDAVWTIVDNQVQQGSGGLTVLNDGIGATNIDAPGAAFYFAHGSLEGRFRAELGSAPIPVERISSYSWHKATRAAQVYRVYGSDGSAKDFNPTPKNGTDPARCGWTLIADVDTRQGSVPRGGQEGVCITRAGGGPIGSCRYLLFVSFVTETSDGWGHTFFNEIDIVRGK
jgi:RNA polymerase sigma factor (sigma-70 family)